MNIEAIKTRIFQPGESLADFIIEHVSTIREQSVLVVTSKIAALAEGRFVEYESEQQKEALIKQESDVAVQTPFAWLSIKDGMVVASAGIDASNGNGKLIFLPKDSHALCQGLRVKLKDKYHVKELGVLIIDSRVLPLRRGTVGMALGYSGFLGLYSYIGKPDLFGRPLQISQKNVADSLATAASLLMGEGDESKPLVIITETGIQFTDEPVALDELRIPLSEDLYGPLFRSITDEK